MTDPRNTRIVFMGTPEFAVGSLRALKESGMNIAGVVTAPDKPAGRGQKTRGSEVKQFALQHGLPVLQPEKLRDPLFISRLQEFSPDLIIVVAFRMLPDVVWKLPVLGTINLHASLLPQYRGAAPINHAIMNGERTTGVTTFLINENIDTGNILMQREVDITDTDTAGSLHDRLMNEGADLLIETVRSISMGNISPVSQADLVPETGPLKTAPKLYREDCRIRWDRKAREVHNHIRGLSPSPAAWTKLCMKDDRQLDMKIFLSGLTDLKAAGIPGSLITDQKNYLHVNCADYRLEIVEIQAENKKRLPVREFLRGFDLRGPGFAT